jgi:hypothetical protein
MLPEVSFIRALFPFAREKPFWLIPIKGLTRQYSLGPLRFKTWIHFHLLLAFLFAFFNTCVFFYYTNMHFFTFYYCIVNILYTFCAPPIIKERFWSFFFSFFKANYVHFTLTENVRIEVTKWIFLNHYEFSLETDASSEILVCWESLNNFLFKLQCYQNINNKNVLISSIWISS